MSFFGGDCNCHLLKQINQDLIPHETLVTLPIIKAPRGVRHMPKGLSANKRRGRTRQNVQDKGPEQSPEEIWKLAVVY